MKRMIVTAESLKFGRNVLKTGAEFEASEKEAKLFKAMGKAVELTVSVPVQVEAVEEQPKKPRGRARKYERRDLTAGPTGEESEQP